MSQKSAAFMSPQAAIARGRENSKGAKKNPMKLIYNFDAHKKTASEGMFSNPSSEIPDELWRAPAPMQRQVDAAVLWAELTGKHASGCGSHGPAKAKKKTVKKASAEKTARNETAVRLLHAINDNRVAAGAIAGTPVGMGKAYLDYRPQESGISNAEASLVGRLAELRAKGGASKSEIDSLKRDMERAKDRRENLARTVALGGATGGAMGAGLGALSKYRRAAAKARK